MTFDQAAINAVYAAAVTRRAGADIFEVVIQHEPKAAPVAAGVRGVDGGAAPVAALSGLSATSGRLELHARIYLNFLGKPEDQIDPQLVRLDLARCSARTPAVSRSAGPCSRSTCSAPTASR